MFLNKFGCKDKKKFRFPPREKRNFLCMNIDFNISRAQGNIRYARALQTGFEHNVIQVVVTFTPPT